MALSFSGGVLEKAKNKIDEEQDDGFDVRLLHRSLRAAANKKHTGRTNATGPPLRSKKRDDIRWKIPT